MKCFFLFLKNLYLDAKNIKDKDPAARSLISIILLYPGFRAIVDHRIAHFLYQHKFFSLQDLFLKDQDLKLVLKFIRELK